MSLSTASIVLPTPLLASAIRSTIIYYNAIVCSVAVLTAITVMNMHLALLSSPMQYRFPAEHVVQLV